MNDIERYLISCSKFTDNHLINAIKKFKQELNILANQYDFSSWRFDDLQDLIYWLERESSIRWLNIQ